MFVKLMSLLPRDLLVYLYKHTPFVGLKNWIVYRAQHKFLVAVLGIFTNEEGKILLLKHVYRREPWGIPGGWMELETPEAGLEREVFEETGLTVQITGLAKALYNRNPNRVDLIFRGKIIGGTFQACSEISEICYCHIGDWPSGMPISQQKLLEHLLK